MVQSPTHASNRSSVVPNAIIGKLHHVRVAMRSLSLSRLLQIVVALPLSALAAFSGILLLDTFDGYRDIERVTALEKIVVAASHMTVTPLNQEIIQALAFVTSGSELDRAKMQAARQRSDQA